MIIIINNNKIVNGFKDADIHDSKNALIKIPIKIGKLFKKLLDLKNDMMRKNKNDNNPVKPVSYQIVKNEL
tara:strand:+ start:232 stop:444 length:213 start_codon:yes stop_codon:yes gene_type:complete